MCYSGRCTWERQSGDCGFPNIKEVRDKYPIPLCEIDPDSEDELEKLKIAIEDVKQIVAKYEKNISCGL